MCNLSIAGVLICLVYSSFEAVIYFGIEYMLDIYLAELHYTLR